MWMPQSERLLLSDFSEYCRVIVSLGLNTSTQGDYCRVIVSLGLNTRREYCRVIVSLGLNTTREYCRVILSLGLNTSTPERLLQSDCQPWAQHLNSTVIVSLGRVDTSTCSRHAERDHRRQPGFLEQPAPEAHAGDGRCDGGGKRRCVPRDLHRYMGRRTVDAESPLGASGCLRVSDSC